MSAKWLFPDQRPFWAQPESKEDDMTKTTAKTTKTTATKKETTMTTEYNPTTIRFAANDLKGREWIVATMGLQAHAVAAVRELYGNEPKFAPVSLYKELKAKATGKKPGMLNQDPEQLKALGIIAHDLGWTNPYFLTESNVAELGGTIKDGAYRHMMTFEIGAALRRYYVVNVDDVEWPNGKVPTSLPKKEAAPKAPKATSRRFKPVVLNLPGGGSMTVHNKKELEQYKQLVALMS